MRFSLWLPANLSWSDLSNAATHAESRGWEGLWLADHFMANTPEPNDTPMGECFAQLAGLAAVVPRVRLGSMVAGNTYRHPAILAKTATTIDTMSGGRFVLGVGAGWQLNEHQAYGIDLGSVKDRLAWFKEACQIWTSLRDEPRTTFNGTKYQLTDAPLQPKPTGKLPLLIGASGEKTMPKIVAAYADEWNTWSTPEIFVHKTEVFSLACQAAERDPATLVRSTQALVMMGEGSAQKAAEIAKTRPAIGGSTAQLQDILGQYQAAGLDEFILPTLGMSDPAKIQDFADQFLTEVAAPFRNN